MNVYVNAQRTEWKVLGLYEIWTVVVTFDRD